MLQDIMHNNSISVVEEPVLELEPPVTPHTPTSKTKLTHTLLQPLHTDRTQLTSELLSLQLLVTLSQR